MYIVYVAFIIRLLYSSSTKVIQLPIKKAYRVFEASATFEDSNDKISFVYDLTTNFTLFWNTSYPTSSINIVNNAVPIQLKGNVTIITQEVMNQLTFQAQSDQSPITFTSFPFYYYQNESSSREPMTNRIGLKYKYDNYSYSFIHHFKKQGLIDDLTFSFIRHDYIYNYLYIGGIPSNISNDYFHSTCSIIDNADNWDCSLLSLSIAHKGKVYNYTANSNTVISFQRLSSIVFAPKSFIEFIINDVVQSGLMTEACVLNELDNRKFICCHSEYIFNMGNIVFQIEKYNYTIDFTEFWTCFDEICDFDIFEHPHKSDEWVFGGLFFDKFILRFDYDNKQIHFYSNNGKIFKNDLTAELGIGSYYIRLLLMNSLIIVKLVGIAMIFQIKGKIQKKEVITIN